MSKRLMEKGNHGALKADKEEQPDASLSIK